MKPENTLISTIIISKDLEKIHYANPLFLRKFFLDVDQDSCSKTLSQFIVIDSIFEVTKKNTKQKFDSLDLYRVMQDTISKNLTNQTEFFCLHKKTRKKILDVNIHNIKFDVDYIQIDFYEIKIDLSNTVFFEESKVYQLEKILEEITTTAQNLEKNITDINSKKDQFIESKIIMSLTKLIREILLGVEIQDDYIQISIGDFLNEISEYVNNLIKVLDKNIKILIKKDVIELKATIDSGYLTELILFLTKKVLTVSDGKLLLIIEKGQSPNLLFFYLRSLKKQKKEVKIIDFGDPESKIINFLIRKLNSNPFSEIKVLKDGDWITYHFNIEISKGKNDLSILDTLDFNSPTCDIISVKNRITPSKNIESLKSKSKIPSNSKFISFKRIEI